MAFAQDTILCIFEVMLDEQQANPPDLQNKCQAQDGAIVMNVHLRQLSALLLSDLPALSSTQSLITPLPTLITMKVTGILASLAVASTTAAAAVPANLDVTQIQSTVSHLDTVLTNLDGAAKSGTISKADLADSSDRMIPP